MKYLINPCSCKCELWTIPLASILVLMLMMGCTKQEYIDLPGGDVAGSIDFKDIDYSIYQYPGISFRIKAQSDTITYWTSADKNGKFNFSELPSGGYNFTLLDNNIEVMSIKHCSFLGGAQPSELSFWYRIQPDIKSIDYHFEIIKDTIWMIGKVELDGIPPIDCNKIKLYASFPPDNSQYYDFDIPFDKNSRQIRCMISKIYDLKSGEYINSYIYKKYKDFGAIFSNYVIKEDYSMSRYDAFRSSFRTTSDSTSTYKFIIP
jgi:hypothetical protein